MIPVPPEAPPPPAETPETLTLESDTGHEGPRLAAYVLHPEEIGPCVCLETDTTRGVFLYSDDVRRLRDFFSRFLESEGRT